MDGPSHQLTQLLSAAGDGDEAAQGQLWSVVYDQLRAIARRQMHRRAGGQAIQPTTVVHEAWFRLFGDHDGQFANRRHFFSVAARAMRQIRLDDVRKRGRQKRGGDRRRLPLGEGVAVFEEHPAELLAVDEALDRLERVDPDKAQIVMLRYFGGLTEEETATALGVSRRKVQADWRVARAWLHHELSKGDSTVHDRPEG